MGTRTLRVSPEFLVDLLKGDGVRSFRVEKSLPADAQVAGVDGLEQATIHITMESAEWPEHYGSWMGPEIDAIVIKTDGGPDDPRDPRWRAGCLLAGPGRGDCEHFVGRPAIENYPVTVDEYGIPHGWCLPCWQREQIFQLRARQFKRLDDFG